MVNIKDDEEYFYTIFELYVIDNDESDEYYCTIDYSKNNYKEETIVKFFQIYNNIISKIVNTKNLNECKLKDIMNF